MTRQRFNRGALAAIALSASRATLLCVLCGLCGSRFVDGVRAAAAAAGVQVVGRGDVARRHRRRHHGKPITNLTPADFVVRIDGNERRVVTAEWVPLTSGDEKPAAVVAPPEGYSTNENSIGGRLIVIAIDQPNIRFGGALAIARAANAFIDRLPPSDRIAVAGFGAGRSGHAVHDRPRAHQADDLAHGRPEDGACAA